MWILRTTKLETTAIFSGKIHEMKQLPNTRYIHPGMLKQTKQQQPKNNKVHGRHKL